MMQGCYFLFINTVVSALRVRFLDELSKFPKGLTLEEIISYYNPKEITQNRIDKLSSARQIYVKKNRYFIGTSTLSGDLRSFDESHSCVSYGRGGVSFCFF